MFGRQAAIVDVGHVRRPATQACRDRVLAGRRRGIGDWDRRGRCWRLAVVTGRDNSGLGVSHGSIDSRRCARVGRRRSCAVARALLTRRWECSEGFVLGRSDDRVSLEKVEEEGHVLLGLVRHLLRVLGMSRCGDGQIRQLEQMISGPRDARM